jgi:hypothetical protein
MLEELVAHPDASSSECMRAAYARTLSAHHNYVVRKFTSFAFVVVPGRAALAETWGSTMTMQRLAAAANLAHKRIRDMITAVQ